MTKLIILTLFIFFIGILFIHQNQKNQIYAFDTQPPGLGQCHWVGGPYYNSSPNIYWAYGGQTWASAEPMQGQFDWSLLRSEVNTVRAKNNNMSVSTTMWLNLQTAEDTTASNNIPQWALDLGVKTVKGKCGKYPYEISAVWDPKYRELYVEALKAMKKEFQKDIDDGVITGVTLMSGGNYGESIIKTDLAPWDCDDPDENCTRTNPNIPCYCKPDVLNEDCPIIKSIAATVSKSARDIAQKSMCNANQGEEVKVCSQEPCPADCYAAEDYFIQGVKDLIDKMVPIFDPLPIIWQWGPGLSGTGRTGRIIQDWFNQKYGSRIWMKFNGWGPQGDIFLTRNFNSYGRSTRHGYEAGHPMYFTRNYWNMESANYWCSWQNPKPAECLENPLNPNNIAKKAIAAAIQKGILEDRSSYLCLQEEFFGPTPVDRGNGKYGNDYYFNPADDTADCRDSEINTASYGVGFCPGYLNYVLSQADNPNDQSFSCASCPGDKIPKEKGNANCDNAVNDADYNLWKGVYIKINTQQPVNSEQEAAAVDFNCTPDQSSHTINLVDFEIWRRNAF